MELRGATVSSFHSPYQYPVNHKPFGFVLLAEGYTPQRVAEYWQVALNFADSEARQGRQVNAWQILRKCWKDLDEVKQGRWPAPQPRP